MSYKARKSRMHLQGPFICAKFRRPGARGCEHLDRA